MTNLQKNTCNTCHFNFDEVEVMHQSFSNRNFLATRNKNGEIIQECCESCVQECMDEVGIL
jgi:hypothetical protein